MRLSQAKLQSAEQCVRRCMGMALLVSTGLTPLQELTASTSPPAKAFGLSDRVPSILACNNKHRATFDMNSVGQDFVFSAGYNLALIRERASTTAVALLNTC